MNKKSEKIKEFKPLPIIILLILLFGSTAYICIKNISSKSKEKVNNKVIIQSDNNELSEDDIALMFKNFFSILKDNKNNKINTIDLTDEQIINIVSSFINNDDFENYNPDGGIFEMGSFELPVNKLKIIANKYFEKEFTPLKKLSFLNYECNLDNNIYKCNTIPTGVNTFNEEKYVYIPVEVISKNKSLIINGVKVYETANSLYIDDKKTNKICDITEVENSLIFKQEKECVKTNTSLKKVSITFGIKENNYYFESLSK